MTSTRPAWFRELFGFNETPGGFKRNQSHFKMHDGYLVCDSAVGPGKRMYVGPFTTPSLAELRERICMKPDTKESMQTACIKFHNMAAPSGVVPLITDPANAGAVFQAASQFNALEMTGPGVTPGAGIAIYHNDPTQGPKCALACPAGTIFRNYLYNEKGQGDEQLDCLADVGALLGNSNERIWSMKNGYVIPRSCVAMKELEQTLGSNADLVAEAEAALRIAVHWDTQVRPPGTHTVAQVYASALPIAYAREIPLGHWQQFAKLVLRAAYDATLCVAAVKSQEQGGKRVKVFLTSLGGGAFGNPREWIQDAVAESIRRHSCSALDVHLVHYGSHIPVKWSKLEKSL